MSDKGHIELERQIDSITVGVRHRKDPGDLNALMKSIEEVGLLQPVTITPDGVLICGWRRLEALRRLGRRTLNVWVRSGISDELSHLLAQQDENEQRIHDSERPEAVAAGRLDRNDGDSREIPAHGGPDGGEEERRPPRTGARAQPPELPRKQRIGQQTPERHRRAEERGPAALLHDVALRARTAECRLLAEPRDERQVGGQPDPGHREPEEPVVERVRAACPLRVASRFVRPRVATTHCFGSTFPGTLPERSPALLRHALIHHSRIPSPPVGGEG